MLFDVKNGLSERLVTKSSNGHQSNGVEGVTGVAGGLNRNVIVSCLGTAAAPTRPTQMRTGRAMLPKYIVYGPGDDDEVGSEDP